MYRTALVAIEKATPQFDKCYHYLIPDGMQPQVGCRVTVPFGHGNRRRMGVVLGLEELENVEKLKAIATLVDAQPLLGEEQLKLVEYLHEQTFCSYFDGVKVQIPAGMGMLMEERYALGGSVPEQKDLSLPQQQILEYLAGKKTGQARSDIEKALGLVEHHPAFEELMALGLVVQVLEDRRKIQDERVVMVRLTALEQERKLTPKQAQVAAFLEEAGAASVKEVCYYCGVGRTVVENLAKQGVAELYEQPVYRNPYQDVAAASPEPIVLSPQQQAAFDGILAERERPSLLYGVTGSGKTQVFLHLIDHVLAQGRQVIVMVPEIALTPQTIEGFHRRYGARTAVLHSSLTMAQRMDEWRRIREGGADIVVGTRSAVFAPLGNLGLIVLDEEQEHTYKSESSPRFHAREVARFRCRFHGAKLLLCSATPSVESYYKAKTGQYHLAVMDQRYAGTLPDVYVVDLATQPRQGDSAISETLSAELYHNLQAGEQSILLLNRRGYHTVIKCSSCGEAVRCPNCSVTLTYHRANGQLMCHYCGHTQPIPKECPQCGSTLVRFGGYGTQKVEEELHTLFPQARVLRMDMDTTMSRTAYEQGFGAFARGEYDIMVGTQMVSKGLNFPKVTLVGVLSADMSLYSEDFRSYEKTFALLTQVVGRSGRYDLPGRAYIQTFQPENPIFELAARQDYDRFYQEEIGFRKLNLYPPFCDLAAVGFSGVEEVRVQQAAHRFAAAFAEIAGARYGTLPIRLLGPNPAAVYRVAGKYRYQLLIKCRNTPQLRRLLREVQAAFYQDHANRLVTAAIDMHCENGL